MMDRKNKIYGHVTDLENDWIDHLLDIIDYDRNKMIELLKIFESYKDKIKKQITDENIMQNRQNYTGDFVRKYFLEYAGKHKQKPKMKTIEEVAAELGLSSKTIEKHIYKK